MTTRIWSGAAGNGLLLASGNNNTAGALVSTDSIIFPAMAASAAKNVIYTAADEEVLLANFSVETGSLISFGTRLSPVFVDADYLTFRGGGSAWLKVTNSAEVDIFAALSAASDGGYGVNLSGPTNALLIVDPARGGNSSGKVGIAAGATETAGFTTITIASGNVWLGEGVKQSNGSDAITALHHAGGTTINSSGVVTVNLMAGTYTQQKGVVTNLNLFGGRYYANSTDTITAAVLYSGVLDLSQDRRAKTVTTLTIHVGASIYDPANILTVTNPLVRAKGGTLSLT